MTLISKNDINIDVDERLYFYEKWNKKNTGARLNVLFWKAGGTLDGGVEMGEGNKARNYNGLDLNLLSLSKSRDFTGDINEAHLVGCKFVEELAAVKKKVADIGLITNGGYSLDQNIYQTVIWRGFHETKREIS